jgi:hypothetical protein
MPIRAVKQYTDRGKIKDLVKSSEIDAEPLFQPSSTELRMKKLFEYAQLHKDKELQSSLGIITTDYISDKNALPLSIYRIRQIVDDIKSKSSEKINQLSQQFMGCFNSEPSPEAIEYLSTRRSINKIASARRPPVFWRASRK